MLPSALPRNQRVNTPKQKVGYLDVKLTKKVSHRYPIKHFSGLDFARIHKFILGGEQTHLNKCQTHFVYGFYIQREKEDVSPPAKK